MIRDDWYDVAQICLNGHLINDATKENPQHNQQFCDKCGSPTIFNCQKCRAEIRGDYHMEAVLAPSSFEMPSFCINCGAAFPWTEAKIQAARDLASGLSGTDKAEWDQSVEEIVHDTPKSTAAATKIKRFLDKFGKPIANTFKDLVVDLVSEAAKKILWP